MSGAHVPVMLREVMAVLHPHDDAIYIDGTFGGGGYSQGAVVPRATARSSASTAMARLSPAAARWSTNSTAG